MGLQWSKSQIAFDDIQHLLSTTTTNYLLIHTLNESEQNCLIKGTLNSSQEIQKINDLLTDSGNPKRNSIQIIVYGKNSNDTSVFQKYKQLTGLGFRNVFVYSGGLFEWLLLQDIYGEDMFPTQGETCLDHLQFKPPNLFPLSSSFSSSSP